LEKISEKVRSKVTSDEKFLTFKNVYDVTEFDVKIGCVGKSSSLFTHLLAKNRCILSE
jgi:hypothetical protein